MIPPHDADLTARWQRGEEAAFEEIVRLWQQPVARCLHRCVGDAALVQDLCQEVFLRVLAGREGYRDNGRFAAWIYTIARNVARDAARRRRPELRDVPDACDGSGDAESVCRRRELTRLVADAVRELPDHLRIVLILRHEEGLSFEEIARLTSTPASTLKSRFAVALDRLRARLARQGYGPEELHP